jgi:hypothetical protein
VSKQVKVALIGAVALIAAAAFPVILSKIRNRTDDYTGRIVDGATNKPVPMAKVGLELDQQVPQVLFSDSEGIFHATLPVTTQSVHIWVDVDTYDHYDRNVSVSRTGIELVRLQKAAPRVPLKPGSTLNRNQDVVERKAQIVALRGDWETIPVSGNVARMKVSHWAPKLGKEMLDIPDGSITFLYRIVKYEYAAYAFTMAASTEDNANDRISFADRSIGSGNEAERLLTWAENSQEAASLADFHWASRDDTKPRVDYLLAIDYCIKAKEEKSPVLKDRVKQTLDGIPQYFKDAMPPDRNQDLQGCLETS